MSECGLYGSKSSHCLYFFFVPLKPRAMQQNCLEQREKYHWSPAKSSSGKEFFFSMGQSLFPFIYHFIFHLRTFMILCSNYPLLYECECECIVRYILFLNIIPVKHLFQQAIQAPFSCSNPKLEKGMRVKISFVI